MIWQHETTRPAVITALFFYKCVATVPRGYLAYQERAFVYPVAHRVFRVKGHFHDIMRAAVQHFIRVTKSRQRAIRRKVQSIKAHHRPLARSRNFAHAKWAAEEHAPGFISRIDEKRGPTGHHSQKAWRVDFKSPAQVTILIIPRGDPCLHLADDAVAQRSDPKGGKTDKSFTVGR